MLNMTDEDIVIRTRDGDIKLERDPNFLRATMSEIAQDEVIIDGKKVPVIERVFDPIQNMPSEDVPCLVRAIVLQACPGRKNMYTPDYGPSAVKDANGRITAYTRLIKA
jgi:hypothetical protein